MSKIGVSLSIDVTAIIKDHINNHQNGKKYLDMTVFIDPNTEDNYGNHGMIVQNWKDAPKGGTPILGNAKVFWRDPNQAVPNPQYQPEAKANPAKEMQDSNGGGAIDPNDDIPFSPVTIY
jgi:hypothetical protein